VAPRGHEVILLVEDDVAVLVGISSVLRGHGYRVLSACSMRAALECVKDEATHVDLLITDLVFSDGAGLDLAAALAVRWPALSLVVIADQSQQPEAALGEMRERLTWIEKPISPDALLFVIRNCLDQGRAQASLGALGNA
jgi:DNA-binding NtrC family response regulator